MPARWPSTVVKAAIVVVAVASSALVGAASKAQSLPGQRITHVICVTNETADTLTLWVDESPEATGPRTGFGAIPNAPPNCYRRVAVQGSLTSIVISDQQPLSVENIRSAGDFERLAAQMRAERELPPVCEIQGAMIEQADVERRLAVLLRVYAGDGRVTCEASVGAAPAGAEGLDAFDVTRSGERPVYYESAERISLAFCVTEAPSRGVAVWPRVRPDLAPFFFPIVRAQRTQGTWLDCQRMWLHPGNQIDVLLGEIRARQAPDSPDFAWGCEVSAGMIAEARTGERRGVFVRVQGRRSHLRCDVTIESAPEGQLPPERSFGLHAFVVPPVAEEE